MQLFVGTPNLESRVKQFRQKLTDRAVEEDAKERAIAEFEAFIDSVWNEQAQFLTFLEGLQLAKACANVVARGKVLHYDYMKAQLDSQAAVMTVRGQVREEYLESIGLTRL